MAGGNAIIVAVIIPVAAAVRLTPPTVAALMMTAGSVGLFTGPFTPSAVTILSLGGLSYPDYLLYVGLPMSAVTLLAGWVMAGRIQKMTEGKLRYDVDLAEKPQEDLSAAQQRRRKLSALAFAATIIVMAIVGVVIKAGFSFAIIVMLLVALMTGLVGGLRPTQILQALYHGCGRLVWMFILYWLYNPILELMDGLHAYQGLLEYTQPLLEGISPAWLCFSIFAFNIIGHVPGAAVAQMTFTHKIFGPMLMAAGVPPQGTTAVLLASSQVDWFGPFPSSDMFGQMGLAQSTHLKYMGNRGGEHHSLCAAVSDSGVTNDRRRGGDFPSRRRLVVRFSFSHRDSHRKISLLFPLRNGIYADSRPSSTAPQPALALRINAVAAGHPADQPVRGRAMDPARRVAQRQRSAVYLADPPAANPGGAAGGGGAGALRGDYAGVV